MLETLDTINWHNLTHAYGEADDVPGLLRDLASSDVKARNKAMYALYGNIWHQGTVYEATAYAVPFLIELLQSESVEGKDQILILLFHLACGNSYLDVHQSLSSYDDKRDTPEFDNDLKQELAWVAAAHDAVEAGIETYLDLLQNEDETVRAAAAYLLASCVDQRTVIVPALREHLEEEEDESVRASVFLALGVLGTDGPMVADILEASMTAENGELSRVTAAMALARVMRERTPRAAVTVLVEAMTDPEGIEDEYADLPWADGDVASDAGLYLCHLGADAARFAIPDLIHVLGHCDGHSALNVTNALLFLSFGNQPAPRALDDVQKQVLNALVVTDNAWIINGNMAVLLMDFGLPATRDQLRALLDA